jgi:hypothetical protein
MPSAFRLGDSRPLTQEKKDDPMPQPNWKKAQLYCGIALLTLLILFLVKIANIQQHWMLYDPNSVGPSGYQALNRLLTKNHYRLTKIADLRKELRQPLIIYTADPLLPKQRQRIFKWVQSGGMLIELAQARPQFTRQPLRPLTGDARQALPAQGAWLTGLSYTVQSKVLYGVVQPTEGFLALNHAWLASRQRLGKGTVLIWCDPKGLTNRSLITAPDNGVIFGLLLKTTVPAGTLHYLDWRYRSPNSNFTTTFLQNSFNHYGLSWLLALTGIGLTLWKLAARSARPRPLALSRGRSYDEFVTCLAQLFQRAKAENFVLENLWQALMALCREITGLPAATPLPDLQARLQIITGQNYPELLEINRVLTGPAQRRSKKAFLTTAARLDRIRKELQQWRNSTNN